MGPNCQAAAVIKPPKWISSILEPQFKANSFRTCICDLECNRVSTSRGITTILLMKPTWYKNAHNTNIVLAGSRQKLLTVQIKHENVNNVWQVWQCYACQWMAPDDETLWASLLQHHVIGALSWREDMRWERGTQTTTGAQIQLTDLRDRKRDITHLHNTANFPWPVHFITVFVLIFFEHSGQD